MKNSAIIKSCFGRETAYDLLIPESKEKFSLILFCHGFKGFKDWGHFNLIAEELCNNGFVVLKFNFSFNGGTAHDVIDFPDLEAFGDNNYLKEVEEIHFMVKALKSGQIPVENWNGEIHLLGHSRGGGMAIIAGAESGFVSKVVSWAGISDCINRLPNESELLQWKRDGVRFIKNGRTNQDMPMRYQFVETLMENKERLSIQNSTKKLGATHLIIHGTKDEAVDIKGAREMHLWNPSSKLIEIEGANHVFGGKHPWEREGLPIHTLEAINATIKFLSA